MPREEGGLVESTLSLEKNSSPAQMQIVACGKSHLVGNSPCPSCANGFPEPCQNPYANCGGLVHAEMIDEDDVVQPLKCDQCGDIDFIIFTQRKIPRRRASGKPKARPVVQNSDPIFRSEIEQFVYRFRRTILTFPHEKLPPSLYKSSIVSFPRSGVADITLLLAEFLHRTGYGMAEYVTGWRQKRCHCWLELAGIIIDVAADGIHDAPARVMVTPNRAWHKQFKEDIRHSADIRAYDQRTHEQLLAVYEALATHLKAT